MAVALIASKLYRESSVVLPLVSERSYSIFTGNILTLSETAKRAQINSTDLNEKLTEQVAISVL